MQIHCGKCRELRTLKVTSVKLNVSKKTGADGEEKVKVQPNVRFYAGTCETCSSKLNRIHVIVPEYEGLIKDQLAELPEEVRNTLVETEKTLADKPPKAELSAEAKAEKKAKKAAKKAEKKAVQEKQKVEELEKKRKSEGGDETPAKRRKSSVRTPITELLDEMQKELIDALIDEANVTEEVQKTNYNPITIMELIKAGFDLYVHVAKSPITPLTHFTKKSE